LRRYGTLAGFGAIVLFFAVMLPDTFLTGRNLLNISQQVSMLAVVAFAMTVVMVMGDFDLSVGAMASLSGVVAGVCSRRATGWPGLAAALAVGVLGGVLNGLLVAVSGHPALCRHAGHADDLWRAGVPDQRRAHDLWPRHPAGVQRFCAGRGAAVLGVSVPALSLVAAGGAGGGLGRCWNRRTGAAASMPSAATSRRRAWPASACGCCAHRPLR
jgi:hypothetical protein